MNLSRRSVLAGAGIVLAGGLGYAYTQRPKHATLRPPNPDQKGYFGKALSLSADGSIALVGHPLGGPLNEQQGGASVVERTDSGWSHRTTLDRPMSDSAKNFGSAVALSGDGTTAVVGGHTWLGSLLNKEYLPVTVYERTGGTWSQTAEFEREATRVGVIGASLAVSHDGEKIVVGAPNLDRDSSGTGSVNVFDRNDGSWSRTARLQPPDLDSSNRFGISVGMTADGTTLAVAAPATGRSDVAGTVIVFEQTDGKWTESARLQGRVADGSERSLLRVAISDDSSTILASDISETTFVFERTSSEWVQRTTIEGPATQTFPEVGDSLALSADGTVGVVGVPELSMGGQGESQGEAQIVRRAGGDWKRRSISIGPDRQRAFGTAVAVSDDGTTVMVGDPHAPYRGENDVGAVYVFDDP